MRIDKDNSIAFNTALGTAGAQAVGTAQYGDILDFVKPGNAKDELYLVAVVREAVTSANRTATVNLKVVMDSASAFNVAPVTIAESGAIAVTGLTAGKRIFAQRLPWPMKRYLRATSTVAVEATTAGKIDIILVSGADLPATA